MKNRMILKYLTLTVCATMSLISLVGCKKPTEGVDLIIDTQTNETSLALQFVDAKTGEQITSTDALKITITGDDKSIVTNNIGKVDFSTEDGFLELYFSESKTPSSSSPIRFNLNVTANGYLSNVIPIEISSTGINSQKVSLVKFQNAPNGVGITETPISNIDVNCKMTSDFTFDATPESSAFEKTTASIIIPSGTILQDANGKALKGTVNAQMAYFNAQDQECLAAFPGGMSATTNKGEDIVFKSAGLVSLDLYASNGEVKRFSQPITMNFQIPSGVTDAEGKSVVEGTKIPAWSFDESTGKWTLEDTAVVTLNQQSGKLEASIQASHLSYWNLDWFWGGCSVGSKVKVVSNFTSNFFITANLISGNNPNYGAVNSGYHNYMMINLKNGSEFQFYNAFNNAATLITDFGGKLFMPTLCSGSYTLTIPNTAGDLYKSIKVTVNGRCKSNPGQIYRPTLPVYALDVSKSTKVWEYIGNMVAGKFETSKLQYGKTYRFRTSLAGKTITSPIDFTINQTEYKYDQEMPSTVCSYLSK